MEDVKPSERVPSRRLWLTAGGGQQRGGGRQRGGRQQQQEWAEGGEEGGELQERGRGRRRYKVRRGGGRPAGWQHEDRGEAAGVGQGGEGQPEWGDLEAVIQPPRQQGGGGGGRRQRRPRAKRQRRDADMADADGGGQGWEVSASERAVPGMVAAALVGSQLGQRVAGPAALCMRHAQHATVTILLPLLSRAAAPPAGTALQDGGSEPQRFRRDEDDAPAADAAAPAAAGLAGPPREQVSYGDL